MKLDANRLAIAVGGTTAIFWTICSALVALFSGAMMSMSGHMFHLDPGMFAWTLTFTGFLLGLFSWTICAAIGGWLVARIYNASAGSNLA
jgi:hypothetical protein